MTPEATGLETLDASGAIAQADLVDDDETIILMIRPSLLFIPLSCSMGLVLIAFIALALAYVAHWPFIPWTDVQAFALGLCAAGGRLGWQGLEWYSRVYVLTDRRVIRRMGVLRASVSEMPLSGIRHTSVFARFRERILGLGTIGFATAGSDVFEPLWVMIARPFEVHRVVVEAIARYGRSS
jgi:hypothetical protein